MNTCQTWTRVKQEIVLITDEGNITKFSICVLNTVIFTVNFPNNGIKRITDWSYAGLQKQIKDTHHGRCRFTSNTQSRKKRFLTRFQHFARILHRKPFSTSIIQWITKTAKIAFLNSAIGPIWPDNTPNIQWSFMLGLKLKVNHGY